MVDAILNRFYRPSRFKKNGDVKDVLVVALPMLLSMSFDTLMTFIDRLFLSKRGGGTAGPHDVLYGDDQLHDCHGGAAAGG